MERVTLSDLPQALTLLKAQPHLAMFPLGNLAQYGLDGDAPRAPRLWCDGTAVLCVTQEGMVMPFGPSDAAPAMARVLAGQRICGIIGARAIARAVQAAAGLAGHPARLDTDEPQFVLSLDRLQVPDGAGDLIPLADAPRSVMTAWRVAYEVETLGEDPADLQARQNSMLDAFLLADSHRVLMVNGAPVAMTGFNTAQPEIVQVGGVYTPPAQRGRGYARRAVALHLQQARAQGVDRATLFASGPAAVRAYRAIGFERVGDWTMVLFKQDGAHVDG